MNPALRHLFIASLRRRPLATALSLLAIALGVALGLAVQLIHDAALDEFGRGVRLLAGQADLQVVGPRSGFDDQLYAVLAMRPEVADASPVLEVEARLPALGESLRILGVDVLQLARVHPALMPLPAQDDGPLAALRPERVFLSAAAQARMGAETDHLMVQVGVDEHRLQVAGTVPGAGAGQVLGVMDVAAAQQLFGRIGRLSRIDLRLAPAHTIEDARAALQGLLPAGVELLAPEAAAGQLGALSRAYRVNLTMLAAIALVTGGFLVFSTQLLSVARRRQELAFLRALGMPRASLQRGLLLEGALLGLVGGLCGVLFGYLLTALAFQFLGGDLGAGYFQGVQPGVRFMPGLMAAYAGLGVAAGLLGSWLPAREAGRLVPAQALRAVDGDGLTVRAHGKGALACLLGALVLIQLPPLHGLPLGGYGAVALVLAAAMLCLPGAAALARPLLALRGSALWRLAHARLAVAPGQIVVAGAAVAASVALAASMAIMVSSFRLSVDDWLQQMLPADLYLQASSSAASGYLDEDALARVRATPGVAAIEPVRAELLRLGAGGAPLTLLARRVGPGWGLPLVQGSLQAHDTAHPPLWISEAVVDLFGWRVGQVVHVPLAGRAQAFHVAGVWRDYARQHGALVVELDLYRSLTGDTLSNDLAIRLQAGEDAGAVAEALRERLGVRNVRVSTPGEIRALSLAIFDRTFLVTYLMEAVAVAIGLFGVATSFAALATARRREFGMLRHLGLTRTQIGRLLALEGALGALLAVTVGLMAGFGVAWVLIEVINRQSFHWSMDASVPWGALALFALALVMLAALAARVAGAVAMRQAAVLAVREDW